jgi:hypothetical protein
MVSGFVSAVLTLLHIYLDIIVILVSQVTCFHYVLAQKRSSYFYTTLFQGAFVPQP